MYHYTLKKSRAINFRKLYETIIYIYTDMGNWNGSTIYSYYSITHTHTNKIDKQ